MGIMISDAFIGAIFAVIGFIVLVLAHLIMLSEITVGGIIVIGIIIAMKAASNR
jgi:predicted RND superfamily exporter protein